MVGMRHLGSAALVGALLVSSLALAQTADYVVDADDIVKNTDWKAMETVTVVLEEHSYTPDLLTFEKGKPYRLVIQNKGSKDHYFTAPEFFKAMALRKAQSKDGEIKAPYLKAVEVYKNNAAVEVFFVPVKPGTYPLYCTIDDHREKGMEGKIVIK